MSSKSSLLKPKLSTVCFLTHSMHDDFYSISAKVVSCACFLNYKSKILSMEEFPHTADCVKKSIYIS